MKSKTTSNPKGKKLLRNRSLLTPNYFLVSPKWKKWLLKNADKYLPVFKRSDYD